MNDTYLGFDFGMKRIGVALGSRSTADARPLATVRNGAGGPEWQAVDRLVEDWTPAALVAGVPYNADGSAHAVTVAAQAFAATLAERYRLPVHTVDERYSSLAAADALTARRQRGDHRRVRSGDLDAAAAAVILTDWLAGEANR
ncbi:MAG: Holliday junction resolvase RuvX [Xanthomonadaceae bacterium]|nr:Holliday junction resolvase RuvX [Xanthomonadaceae bacterium]